MTGLRPVAYGRARWELESCEPRAQVLLGRAGVTLLRYNPSILYDSTPSPASVNGSPTALSLWACFRSPTESLAFFISGA